MAVLKEEKERVLVTCAFCRGKGVDPFGIMSHLSTCYVCKGKKEIWVKKPVRDCIFCRGSGVSPTGARNHCPVCAGAGVVHVEEPSVVCPDCDGTGRQRTVAGKVSTSLYCVTCKGTGSVLAKPAAQEALKASLIEKRDTYRKKIKRIDADLARIKKAVKAEEEAKVEV